VPHEHVSVATQLRERAGLKPHEWRALGVDLVAEHPQVSGREAPILAAL
jgi:hypothetical protein